MIYGRCGQPVTIKRIGTLDDVKRLENRRPDKQDRLAVESGSYVVVEDDGTERLYHQAFLRADEGAREIGAAVDALTEKA
jgi:hypothetical protein